MQWSDSSGGYPKQIAVSGQRMYVRVGASDTTWGNWSAFTNAIVSIPEGGTGASSIPGARSGLGVPAEIDIGDGSSGFPFGWGSVIARGYLGNSIGKATSDNYYWGVDSTAILWGGKQTNKATSVTWKRAMMMDSEQRWTTLYSGTLSSGSATLTNGGKYAAVIIGALPGTGEDMAFVCIPGGSCSGQIASNEHWLSFRYSVSGVNSTITIRQNPSGGAIKYVWGLLKYQP